MYKYYAHIDRIIDGDTFEAHIDLGFNISIKATLRLLGIDCPEIHIEHKKGVDEKLEGLICKEIARKYFDGKDVIIETQKPDSFGRTLCNLYYYNDNNELCDVIDLYNTLGINKKSSTFNLEKIKNYSLNYFG